MTTRLIIFLAFTNFLLLAVVLPAAYSEPSHAGFRAAMIRREPTMNLTHAAHMSRERLSMLTARVATAAGHVSAQAPLRLETSGVAYDMKFTIGTPPQKLTALADTGSDLIWAKCGPCKNCTPQGSPSFYPNKSSSFSKLPCSTGLCGVLASQSLAACGAGGATCEYKYSYGLASDPHHYTQGYLGSETFTLDGDAVRGVGFGCTTMSEGNYGASSGIVGLGWGPLSFVSQLNAGAFSYCLTGMVSRPSPLLFGAFAMLTGSGVQSTPLITSTSTTFYIVDLQRISIGSATTTGTGTAGILFDSGTTVAFLAEPAYSAARDAVLSHTKLLSTTGRFGYEACFLRHSKKDTLSWMSDVPSMVLHFDGGADMTLPVANYFGEVERDVVCWIVQKSPSLSIIGNIMQTGFHIRYDLDTASLSFQRADCAKL